MIWDVIPDLIEIGLDVLNPVQPAWMDPAEMKRRFGDRLCFWGSLDEQHTLPFGSPDDVREEVRTRLRTIGRHGGHILGPTHWVQLAARPRGGRKPGFDHAAAPWYSWMSPPSRSRRRISRGLTGTGTKVSASGEARPRARWGRCRL
jgi:hypothetical protein